LENLREYPPHQLLENEEKILAETSPVGAGNWDKLFEKEMFTH
jgi:oligoendopeptidase F